MAIQVNKNFYPLRITYFQFLAKIKAKMKLNGSHRPRTWTKMLSIAKLSINIILRAIIHLTSRLLIL